MPSVQEQQAAARLGSDGAESDGSLSWEEFFGSTTAEDLVPTLLTMYDTLVGRHQDREAGSSAPPGVRNAPSPIGGWVRPHEPPPPPPPLHHHVPRPLSVTSIASSSSSSSSSVGSSSSSGRRLANVTKGSPYLASIESLDDTEDEHDASPNVTHRSHGSGGDSGVCSPCSYISSPSPPHTKPKYCDPHLSYMDRVVMEIVETEGVYVNDLAQVIIGYLERWETCAEPPLNETQLTHLFSNLRDIYNFNGTFLRELEQCGLDPVKVAKVFVKNNVGFSIYTEYCTNYPRTVSMLTELMRKDCTARLFRERQAALQHTLPLGSYLLKPVQRILKYHLLLQNIVKNLQPDAEGYGSVVDALSTMTGIAHHINEMKRKHEHAVRVQEIQSLLLGWHGEDLTTFGELCAEGTFRMAGAKALRHAFLFDQILLITKKKEEGILGYKAHIMCSNLMLIESVPGEPLSFHVIPFDNPRHQYTLQARSLEQKREWTLQLKRVILENYNAVIPSHARQLVMQLGQNRSDDEIMAERATPKKQHSAPEYLERRKQERERRKSETGIRARLRTRTRKSDTGICVKPQQRVRRNSQYRIEDSAVLPAETSMEQCGGMRRKSEPGYYSTSTLVREDSECSIPTTPVDLETTPEATVETISREEGTTSEKKRTLEEIVSQLLMQNKEFQRVLKKQRHNLGSRRHHRGETTSEDEPEDGRGGGFGLSRSTRSLSLNQPREAVDYDNLQDVWAGGGLKRAQSFGSHQPSYSSSEAISLAGSRSSFGAGGGPTSPAVWLKQQHRHLPTPTQHKAGSLPRGFQLGNSPQPWQTRMSPDRPFTIASDKPQDLLDDDMKRMGVQDKGGVGVQEVDLLEDMEDYAAMAERGSGGGKATRRFPTAGMADDTTEEESAGGTPDASMHHLNDLHPEYKIYRTSITTRQTLRQVLSSVSGKLASRLSSETLDQLDVEQRANRLVTAFAKTFRTSKHRLEDPDLPVYKQGSSGLGARIAHGSEISDYADPRTLFPNITPSKKAASLLGIRPYSVLSLVSNLTSSSSSGYAGSSGSQSSGPARQEPPQETREGVESDGSADSYYERTFEAMEASMGDTCCRDSAVFSDPEDLPPPPPIVRKVPPPIPRKPSSLKPNARPPPTPSSLTPTTPDRLEDECDSTSSVASTVIETTTTTKGWVKHVICKIQGGAD